jgi:hypothetical protein
MSRMHKPDPKLAPDKQGERSVVRINLEDVDAWLFGSVEEPAEPVRLAPVGVRSGTDDLTPMRQNRRSQCAD